MPAVSLFRRAGRRLLVDTGLRARWRLRLINQIRNAPIDKLKDVGFLEDMIIGLGLYPQETLHLEEYPQSLWRYCNKGLRIWQYPNQFAQFLVFLSKYSIKSYLEIGVAYGGSLILIIEYLSHFNGMIEAWGIDPQATSELLRAYMRQRPGVRHIRDYSANLWRYFPSNTAFDLALIDGLHTEEASWADFELVRDHARIIVFHDISSDRVPKVASSWKRARREHASEYDFFEFIEQYPEVRERTRMSFLGIGVAVRKNSLP